MKHKAMILFIFILIAMFLNMKFQTVTAHAAGNEVKIPDKAIRLRILANSNSKQDQTIKRQVRDAVNREVATWVHGLHTLPQARKVIKAHIPMIKKAVAQTLASHHVKQTYKVKLGEVQFPTKIYGNYVYPAGKYEALLITLGDGVGANWWCVLFPPLCFLDFQNGDAVKSKATAHHPVHSENAKSALQSGNIHVKFFFIDWINSLFDSISHFMSRLFH